MFANVKMVIFTVCFLIGATAYAAIVEYDLTLDQRQINYTGELASAMTINGGIPGPTLRFTEGDQARITVHNHMDVESSIHWHGLLVPPEMDGVPLISFPPIVAGSTFVYEFPIRQNGTYWYHSHTSLQEQRGVYGAIVIEPRHTVQRAERDYVVLLSDWTDEDPYQVLRTLKRGSEWYALEKGSAQSIIGAAKLGKLGNYFGRELQRMPAMDIADVAYDRFFANGKPELSLAAKSGELVRLRVVDGSATTFFHMEFAGGPMQIIAADGQDVVPIDEQRLLIGVAETYDILIRIPESGRWELRATAHDGSGFASIWLGQGTLHPAPAMPLPDLYSGMGHSGLGNVFALTPAGAMGMADADVQAGRFDKPGMVMDHGDHKMHTMDDSTGVMEHGDHAMTGMMNQQPLKEEEVQELEALFESEPSGTAHAQHGGAPHIQRQIEPQIPTTAMRNGKRYGRVFRPLATDISAADLLAIDGMDSARPWPPYEKLRATRSTALSQKAPVREIRLTLDGDMERYVWFLNNQALSEADDILIREGEVVRFIMINRTMMHHPMHLHGHFFRVINGQGDYSPLKHTVDVAPMSTTVIEFEANEVGDWFFHCHLLYHMKSGMARAIHYENFHLTPQLAAIRPRLYEDSWYAWGQVDILSSMTEGVVTIANTCNIISAEWDAGWLDSDEHEWEGIVVWDRYVNRFFSFFAGVNVGDALEEERAVLGLDYLLPLMIETRSLIGSDGEVRLRAEKSFHLLPRLELDGLVEYDSDEGGEWEYVGGLSYLVSPLWSLRLQWHTDYRWGAGMQVRF